MFLVVMFLFGCGSQCYCLDRPLDSDAEPAGTVDGQSVPVPVSEAWWIADTPDQPATMVVVADFPDVCDALTGYYTDYTDAWAAYLDTHDEAAVTAAMAAADATWLPEEHWLGTLTVYQTGDLTGSYPLDDVGFLLVTHQRVVPTYSYHSDGDVSSSGVDGVDGWGSGLDNPDTLDVTAHDPSGALVGSVAAALYGGNIDDTPIVGDVEYALAADHCPGVEAWFAGTYLPGSDGNLFAI
jgi:hypothetical protein